MSLIHGILIQENPTSLVAPLTADSAIQVIVGTAPIHLTEDPKGATLKPIVAYSFQEAQKKLGYSDDFKNYTLCEAMDASFRVFNVAPLIFINVLDPDKHKETKTKQITLQKGEAILQDGAVLLTSLQLANGANKYTLGTDYTAELDDAGGIIIKRIDKGSLAEARK